MKAKLKEIGLEFLAAAIVAMGVGFATLYLVEVFSFLSLFMGMLGYIILRPAIKYYKESLDEFLK
jgi:hypothetical protein